MIERSSVSHEREPEGLRHFAHLASPGSDGVATRVLHAMLRFDAGALVFALVSATLFVVSVTAYYGGIVLGQPFSPYAWVSGGVLAVLVLAWALVAAILYFLATGVLVLWGGVVTRKDREVTGYKEALNRRFWPCAAALALCWAPWVIASLPATMDQDTIWQVLIWRTPAMWYDHHPWLTTMLFGSIFDAGAALGSQSITLSVACVVQSLLYVAVTSAALCYVWRFERARGLFWFAIVCACLVPAFPFYACRLEKDTLFCLGLVPFMILLLDGVRTRGHTLATPGRTIVFCALAIWLVLTKKTGVYIVVPTLLFFGLYCARERWQPAIISMVVGAGCFAVWQLLVLPMLGVAPGPRKELFSLPFQQTARVVALYPGDVTPEEHAAIDAVLYYDSLHEQYRFDTADSVKDNYKDLSGEALVPYFKAWLAMGLRHPGAYATATLGTNLKLFDMAPFNVEVGSDPAWVEENVEFFSQFLHDGLTEEEIAERDEVTQEGIAEWPGLAWLREVLDGYAAAFRMPPLLLVNAPALMQFYLPFLCACCIVSPLFKGARGAVFVAVVPWALIVASIIVGPMTLDRYFITGLWGFPLLLVLPMVCRLSSVPHGSTKGGRHAKATGFECRGK